MKLTNELKGQLAEITERVEGITEFLKDKAVCNREKKATSNLHYTRTRDDSCLYEINQFGTELTANIHAIKRITNQIKENND